MVRCLEGRIALTQFGESVCIALCLAHLGIPVTAAVTSSAIACGICVASRCLVSEKAPGGDADHRALIVSFCCVTMLFSGSWLPLAALGLLVALALVPLSSSRLRQMVRDAIPDVVLQATRVGMAMLAVAWICLACGVIVRQDGDSYALSGLFEPEVVDASISLVAMLVFSGLNLPAAPVLALAVAAVAGVPLGLTQAPSTIVAAPDFGLATQATGFLATGFARSARSLFSPAGLSVVMLLAGSLAHDDGFQSGLNSNQAGHITKTVEGMILAAVTGFSALLGVPVPPAASGSDDSGVVSRSVLVAVSLCVAVLLAIFSPVVAQVPMAAAFGPLLFGATRAVGRDVSLPVNERPSSLVIFVLVVVGTLLGPSAACGFAFGIVTWTLVELLRGGWRKVPVVTYFLAALCVVLLVLLLG